METIQGNNQSVTKVRKEPFGRPLKVKDATELQKRIDNYFSSCFRTEVDNSGQIRTYPDGTPILTQIKPFTITGLALELDISRQCLMEYGTREDFGDIIRRAKQRCEDYAEQMLYNRNAQRGAQFVLNTSYHGWVEKKEVVTTNETTIKTQLDPARLTGSDLKALSEAFKRAGLLQDAQVTDIQTDNPKTQENAQKEDK